MNFNVRRSLDLIERTFWKIIQSNKKNGPGKDCSLFSILLVGIFVKFVTTKAILTKEKISTKYSYLKLYKQIKLSLFLGKNFRIKRHTFLRMNCNIKISNERKSIGMTRSFLDACTWDTGPNLGIPLRRPWAK